MNKFLQNMERKLGKYAIPDLINYFIILYVASTVISLFLPNLYAMFLGLDFKAIMQGQIWRVFTFILAPTSMDGMFGILFFVITVHIYYLFGHALENIWGAFRFNLYFIGGIILTFLVELVLFLTIGANGYYGGMRYLYQSMFFAFCMSFPDQEFRLYFLIPIKAKWLAALDGVLLLVEMAQYCLVGFMGQRNAFTYSAAILVAMLNFAIFYYAYKNPVHLTARQKITRNQFRQESARAQAARAAGVTKHKCAICGRTDVSHPDLTFRFCSKCNGNYEYCEEHLFTHRHVGM